jgi:hypothetical protein
MGLKPNARFAVLAAALVAMLGVGMLTVSANVSGIGDSGWLAFAQNGNGDGNNGNGKGNNGNSENPGNSGNNGNGNQGNPGNGNGNPPENPGNSENAPGQQEAEPVTPAEDEAPAEETESSDQSQGGAEKVNVCHVTDQESGDSHMISISTNAVPAHEAHGDTLIDVASEDECTTAEAPIEEEAPAATPVPDTGDDEGDGDGDEEDNDGDLATPVPATPVATPIG